MCVTLLADGGHRGWRDKERVEDSEFANFVLALMNPMSRFSLCNFGIGKNSIFYVKKFI